MLIPRIQHSHCHCKPPHTIHKNKHRIFEKADQTNCPFHTGEHPSPAYRKHLTTRLKDAHRKQKTNLCKPLFFSSSASADDGEGPLLQYVLPYRATNARNSSECDCGRAVLISCSRPPLPAATATADKITSAARCIMLQSPRPLALQTSRPACLASP